MPPNLGGFFMVRSYYPSECHADYFDFERIEALKPAIEACGISTLSQSQMLGFFFFQAEDGIRYYKVTGVKTCALPILELIEEAFCEQWGRVLASLMGFLGDFELAEEATAEAFAIAAERWPRDGTPANPAGWLVATARNRAIDRVRRARTLAAKTRELEVAEATVDEIDMDEIDAALIKDERLELIFMCCHPALAAEAQVALTLRALGGLTTEEIARAFLVSE